MSLMKDINYDLIMYENTRMDDMIEKRPIV